MLNYFFITKVEYKSFMKLKEFLLSKNIIQAIPTIIITEHWSKYVEHIVNLIVTFVFGLFVSTISLGMYHPDTHFQFKRVHETHKFFRIWGLWALWAHYFYGPYHVYPLFNYLLLNLCLDIVT